MDDTSRRISNHNAKRRTSGKRINDRKTMRMYEPYLEAEWGFMNHWYPARFSHEVRAGSPVGIQICGVPLLLIRSGEKVYCVKDQCIHRGVRFSENPLCYKEGTLTCWYHGFTFDVESGDLVTIVAAPDDPVIGTTGVQTYPTYEVNGMIFVFVCDEDWEGDPAPIVEDLPVRYPENSERFPHPMWPPTPSVLDENSVCLGLHRKGFANWRVAVENGFDAGHLLIHRDSAVLIARELYVPLGMKPTDENAMLMVEDEDGPKGFINTYFTDSWQPVVENEVLGLKPGGKVTKAHPFRTGVFLPGVLMVENWPEDSTAQYEWYVPITDDTYEYWEVLVKHCENEEERKAFEYRYENYLEPLYLRGFNNCDLEARDAMQDFYGDGTGWQEEQLGDMDASVITWRKTAARYNRGIAEPPKGVPGAQKAPSYRFEEARTGGPINDLSIKTK